uniref:leucine--tRNA ligase n=1 Tax=Sinocyclocheilus anshuiensis TaxID=1608454 RepID=A0A671S9G2_9TELE
MTNTKKTEKRKVSDSVCKDLKTLFFSVESQWDPKPSWKKFYVLSMFPYPSGRLHMGHVRVYTISDTIGHFQRMRVLNPMGWDAYGLPAEHAAWTRRTGPKGADNIESMRKQLDSLGLCFNWDREVTTCLPDYYKWTQYLFIKLFEAGLAYQKEVRASSYLSVCVSSTIERSISFSHHHVTLKTGPLLDALTDLPEWYGVKSMQANWIGDCSGCFFNHILKVLNASSMKYTYSVVCYTCSPEAVFGAAYVSVLPSHRLLHGSSAVTKNYSLTEVTALNVFTGREVPVVIFGKNEFDGHLDTVIGIPESNEEDAELARSLGLSWNSVLKTEEDGTQTLINSDEFTGQSRVEAFNSVTQKARERNAGAYLTSTKLRDWLISRQCYWGTSIPIVHCGGCGPVPVPVEELPVMLPKVPSLTGKGASPLKKARDWLSCQCPRCKGPAERETDTMDTFHNNTFCVNVLISNLSIKYNTTVIPAVCFNVMLCLRWQARLWGLDTKLRRSEARKIWENKNYAITQVTGHFTEDFLFNAAISRLMGLTNTLSVTSSRVVLHSVEFEEALASLCVMAAPMCPHLASELWAGLSQVRNPLGSVLSGKGSVLQQPWPSVDPEYLQTPDTLQLSIWVCHTVSVPREVAQDAQKVQELVLNSPLGKAILSPRMALIYFLEDE